MSRHENSGRLVTTQTGQLGRTYNKEKPINGKVPVFLLTEDFRPLLDEAGKQKKLLCDPATLTVRGYCD